MEDEAMSETYSVGLSLENLTLDPDEDENLENGLLHHVLLPRFLPHQKQNILYDMEMELLSRMVDLVDVKEDWIPKPTVEMFKSFYNVQADCQPATISGQINRLQPGDTFAMFVNNQNCMFVIYMPSTDDNIEPGDSTTVIVATSPGNLNSNGIYSNIGDLEFNYPVQALKIKYSPLLRSMEFAEQLYLLHNDEPRSDAQFVSTWLIEALCDNESVAATVEEFPAITKKLRDEAVGRTIHQVFRRSRLYFYGKSLLQHSLTIELGKYGGRLCYKILMLQFITIVCDKLLLKASNNQPFDLGLMNMAMAKLARRIEKLTELAKVTPEDNMFDAELLTGMRMGAIHETQTKIKELRNKINKKIEKLQLDDNENAKLPALTTLNFEEDVHQKVEKLRAYFDKRLSPSKVTSGLLSKNAPKYIRCNLKPYDALPDGYFVERNNATEKSLRLIDFENVVLYDTDLNDKTIVNAEVIRKNSFFYRDATESLYVSDPLATSRMILVRLKQIAILDGIACDQFPLLLKHRSGINPNIIKSLLLPQFIDMKIAHELEEYFRKRNTDATGPSLIEEKYVTEASFGSAFAAQDNEMENIRKAILWETDMRCEQLRREWNEGRQKVSNLRNEMQVESHEYMWSGGQRKCREGCRLCKLKRQFKMVKLWQYVKPLPEKEHEQNALIFERYIPHAVAHLRDALHSFAEYCSGKPDKKIKIMKRETKSAPKKAKKLKKIPQIHSSDLVLGLDASNAYNVCLGSTKCVDQTTLHVDKPFEMFVVENDSDYNFHASEFPMPELIADVAIKSRCTLRVEAESDYKNMQWMINGTSHTENEVLAAQSKCPDGLSLSEFKSFGYLRADGCRLQLRKLYGLIETEALSLEQPSVLSLIIQAIWECEEKGESGAARDSHNDLNRNEFALSIIELLSRFIEQQKDNWINPLKLVTASFIIVRLMEMSRDDEGVNDGIVKVLNNLRIVAIGWIEKIQEAICELENPDQAIEQSLRQKLTMVAFAGIVTFYVHPSHQFHNKILQPNENGYSAYRFWLQFIITLNNNIQLSHDLKMESDYNMTMFLRLVQNIGVQLEVSMKKLISSSLFHDVPVIIRNQWKNADGAEKSIFHFDEECSQIICTEVNGKIVKIFIVTGEFLVNDLPVARLPRKVYDDPLYARVFQSFPFEIQLEDSDTFCTLHKYQNCVYKFNCQTEGIVITERNDNGVEMELLPIDVLETEVPYLLVKDYSHWWNRHENTVDFRPRFFNDKRFATDEGVEYRLYLDKKRLVHLKTERCLLDVTSDSYSQVVQQLSRLEHANFINILLDASKIATIELPRMNLKFKINAHWDAPYEILSNEFNGMRVSLHQKCGTLYGLNHGLVLERVSENVSSANILLMPHATTEIRRHENHVSVNIAIQNELKNPPFHLYRIDNTCRQLKAVNNSHTAWIYLAYLHAITSIGEIEPLTGTSGTESALHILQSGFVWSSVPYNDESIQLLKDFTELSPKRHIHRGKQIVQWPDFIPPHAAQDSYVFIAQKLLEDSQRLHELHFAKNVTIELKTILNQNKREYLRHLAFLPNLRVADTFLQCESIYTTLPIIPKIVLSMEAREISSLYHKKGFCAATGFNLWSFLTEDTNWDALERSVYFHKFRAMCNHRGINFNGDAVSLWMSLYAAAKNKKKFSPEEFVLLWTLLAHIYRDNKSILLLQAVEKNADSFYEPLYLEQYNRYNIGEGLYSKEKVANILRDSVSAADFASKGERDDVISKLSDDIDQAWPCGEIDVYQWDISHSFHYNFYGAIEEINRKLVIWCHNGTLKDFVVGVKDDIQALVPEMTSISQPLSITNNDYHAPVAKTWKKYELNFEMKMKKIPRKFDSDIREAQQIWNLGHNNSKKTSKQWWDIYEKIIDTQIEKYFIHARMNPRSIPSLVLPKIMSEDIDERMKMIIGALAITIAREQRQSRIQALDKQEYLRPDLEKERTNEPFMNWKPREYPEWLIFEIEQNLTIRRIQIEIAKRMMNPPAITNSKHSTMQLNMGEGKTAVIVPILAAVLANGKQAVQITVLKSLFATNVKSIRKYLGGMLNRRVYVFPCRRDMQITTHLEKMLHIYDECKQLKGVNMSLPEYQLSLQLKLYESIQKKELENATKLLSIQTWLNSNIRGILDESDAILQPKYQLIYTLGNQLPLDGGIQRWIVMQALLKRVPHHMKVLHESQGIDCIEFDSQPTKPNEFSHCRILKDSIYSKLKKAIIDDVFADRIEIRLPEMSAATRRQIEAFLSEEGDVKFDSFSNELTKDYQNVILILNGILQFDVLKLMLVKRWRVNYGINPKGKRKMAVPFRAKDVAADMTEFGHPDVAIGFTQLSYYYSGLSDAQLHATFKILAATQNARESYDHWIRLIPAEDVPASIASYSGVNLSDPHQRDKLLFPMFRCNMFVIDFWLSQVVFPNEAKTFEDKLMCTAWDLCSERMSNIVTGFSGTNDTKNILPRPIAQNDLEELESTNENVRKILLQPDNRCYLKLPANVSAGLIINELLLRDIQVLLDAGALMLEFNNKQVAREWLKIAQADRYDAAIYFDTQDILQTIDRNGKIAEFDSSVYRENLGRCLVYLDDTHTRGTDLKFPSGQKACVTLSGDITRDKTVQACNRMRLLGNGHSVEFWASFEADLRLREVCNLHTMAAVSSDHVIKFICDNSTKFEIENTVHWVNAAHNYTKRLVAHNRYSKSINLEDLYNGCGDKEYVTLRGMYSDKEEQPLSTIAFSKFRKLHESNECSKDVILSNYTSVENKLRGAAADIKRLVYILDEEQEKEIEYEPEQQRQVERPLTVEAVIPKFNENLEKLIQCGLNKETVSLAGSHLLPLENGLRDTKLYKDYEKDGQVWSKIYVTEDFKNVIKKTPQANDDFLRPVWWLARIEGNCGDYILVLLSAHESDRLVPTFWKSIKSTLYMYRPRISKRQSDLLDVKGLRISANDHTTDIDVNDIAQIQVYSGSMYFKSEAEQDAYCNFLGLIPRPRNTLHEFAFTKGIIKPNGFVPIKYRKDHLVFTSVGRCKFSTNPVNLAARLIEAHHQFMRKESHATMILERGLKVDLKTLNSH